MLWILLAQDSSVDVTVIDRLLRPEVLPFIMLIVAIIVAGIVAVIKVLIHHRERMAMIEQGMNPDHPPSEEGDDDTPD
jgi:hypothetical protein